MAQELKIEKGIPIPSGKGARFADILRQMKKGDSVFVPECNSTKLSSIANVVLRGPGYVTFLAAGDGVRVWRIK